MRRQLAGWARFIDWAPIELDQLMLGSHPKEYNILLVIRQEAHSGNTKSGKPLFQMHMTNDWSAHSNQWWVLTEPFSLNFKDKPRSST